jgi:hypothetical protein
MDLSAWQSLIAGTVGVGGTLAATLLAQGRSDRREEARWHRDRQHAIEVRQREDLARTYDHRREAYVEYAAAWMSANSDFDTSSTVHPAPAPEGFLDPVWLKLSNVRMYGSREAITQGMEAWKALLTYVYNEGPDDGGYASARALAALQAFVDAARRDLGVPD